MSGGGGGDQVVGYWYSFGIHMGMGRGPINEVVEIRVSDKTVSTTLMNASGVYSINAPEAFGGEKAEGGIVGSFHLLMGEPTQVAPDSLKSMLGRVKMPGFRRMATAFFDGRIAAMNPYPKPWTFRVRRTDKGWDGDVWYPEKIKIVLTRDLGPGEPTSSPEIHAVNPAHMFYEVMTNREWGRGLPRAMLDDESLQAVADQLYDEGFGLCMKWSRTDSIENVVQQIIDHIGAVMRPNRQTGQIQLKLIRNDYIVDDVPLFDAENGLMEVTEAGVATMPTVINQLNVTFMDPLSGKQGAVSVHNLAGVQGSGGEINTMTKDYPGLPTPDLASRVAQRDLRSTSNALRRYSFTLDRRGQNVQPGDVVRIADPSRGIPPTVVRVGSVDDGTLLNGAIKIVGVQDVFALPDSSYVGKQRPQWQPPNRSPCIGYNRTFETPYFMLARRMGAADLDYVAPEAGYLTQLTERGSYPLNAGYKLAVRESAPTPDDMPEDDQNYCPTVHEDWEGGDDPNKSGGGGVIPTVYTMDVGFYQEGVEIGGNFYGGRHYGFYDASYGTPPPAMGAITPADGFVASCMVAHAYNAGVIIDRVWQCLLRNTLTDTLTHAVWEHNGIEHTVPLAWSSESGGWGYKAQQSLGETIPFNPQVGDTLRLVNYYNIDAED